MFNYIIGDIVEVKGDMIVLECNSIGYEINTSSRTALSIKETENVKINTHLSVREDGMTLYGFLTIEEVKMFRLLQTVSKVGPKVALGMMSALSVNDIKRAILFDQSKELAKAPGIGAKTAQRIVLELKDKIDIDDIGKADGESMPVGTVSKASSEVLEALMSLGYTQLEVQSVLSKIDSNGKTTEDIIKLALVNIGR